jgi:hydroxymethylpyrimidine/phosphomethylpyrimidine kinase
LCVGGLDPSGGAGLPADARAVEAAGAHPCLVTTAVIAQNTCGVQRFEAVSAQLLQAQLENLLNDISPHAVKIGMLPSVEAVKIAAQAVDALGVPVIVDTVFAPSTGPAFSDDDTIEAIRDILLPLCELATPNTNEASRLCGFPITCATDAERAARVICERLGARAVLIKGGHATYEQAANDLLFDGASFARYSTPRINGYEVRGTGCMLASAITGRRAQAIALHTAINESKNWLHQKIRTAEALGHGRRVATANSVVLK